ncbi:MAG: tetratricopeptide repeat protein, partial [Bacteroidales bacterium]|nr:tetratricopeptide repeat protein [Bacteroidales bacterium]
LCEISGNYFQIDSSSGIKYGTQALELSEKLHYDFGVIIANAAIGKCYAIQNLLPQALRYFSDGLTMAKKLNKQENIAKLLLSIGNVYKVGNEYDKAIAYYKQAETAYQLAGIANRELVMNNIGNIYVMQKKFDSSLNYYFEAMRMELADRAQPQKLATHYSNIGASYIGLTKYDSALYYLFKALPLIKAAGNKRSAINTLNNIGRTYLAIASSNTINVSDSLKNNERNLAIALQYEKEALSICYELGNKDMQLFILTNISNIYAKQKKYKEALEYFNMYDVLKDSLNTESKIKEFAQVEAEFKVRTTSDSLKFENELKDAEIQRKKQERNGSVALISLAAAIGLLVINRQKLKHKQKTKLAEAEVKYTREKARQQLEDFTKNIQDKNELIEQFTIEIEKYQALPCSNELPEKDRSLKALQDSVIL